MKCLQSPVIPEILNDCRKSQIMHFWIIFAIVCCWSTFWEPIAGIDDSTARLNSEVPVTKVENDGANSYTTFVNLYGIWWRMNLTINFVYEWQKKFCFLIWNTYAFSRPSECFTQSGLVQSNEFSQISIEISFKFRMGWLNS